MKPYLIDVPVCLLVWKRPELQRQSFESIKQARPSILFLISDGGRNEEEWAKIKENREYLEKNIDWECTLYKLYEKKNNGLYAMSRIILKFVFDRVDRIVFLEDDTISDPTVFRFFAELLEKYKDDYRIDSICGGNDFGQDNRTQYDYFFTEGCINTGAAFWKRSVELFDKNDWMQDPYLLNRVSENGYRGKDFDKKVIEVKETGRYDGHIPNFEFYFYVQKYLNHCLSIIPTRNMVRQMGATDDATHNIDIKKLDKKSQKMYDVPICSCEFPLKHPKYVICDNDYMRQLLKRNGGKLERFRRRFVTICKRVYFGDGRVLWSKFLKRCILKDKKIEM